MGVIARADLNCYKIPVSSKEGRKLLVTCRHRLHPVSVGDAVVLARALSIPSPALPCRARAQAGAAAPAAGQLGYPGACSALSLRFVQYGHCNKAVFNVTFSSGNPWLRLSPNREQKENCHVNILADSNLLLFSFFPRLCVKSASSSLHCQMKLLYNTSRSMQKPLLFPGRA